MPLTIGVIGIGVEPQKGPNRGLRTMTRAALKRGWGAGEVREHLESGFSHTNLRRELLRSRDVKFLESIS